MSSKRNIHIAIDITAVDFERPNGIKHYTLNLLNGLGRRNSGISYCILTSHDPGITYGNMHFHQIGTNFSFISKNMIVHNEKPDLIFYPHQFINPLIIYPYKISVIHDLGLPVNSFQNLTLFPKNWLKLNAALKNSTYIIADTDNVNNQIYNNYSNKIPIQTIYPSISNTFKIKIVKRRRFFMTFSDRYGRKDISLVVNSFVKFHAVQPGYNLIIITSVDNKAEVENILPVSIKNNIQILCDIKLKKLVTLYQQSKALLYISKYEGFGMPIIEAMACGCPVIASDIPVLREVGRNTVLFVDNLDDSICQAMTSIVNDRKIVINKVKYGLKRAKQFTGSRFANSIECVFNIVSEYRNKRRANDNWN